MVSLPDHATRAGNQYCCAKTVNFSDLSSSGQNESYDQTINGQQSIDCFCLYHTQMAQSEAILFTSESSESNSYSDTPIPWYKRGLCPWSRSDVYTTDECCYDCPCPGRLTNINSDASGRKATAAAAAATAAATFFQSVNQRVHASLQQLGARLRACTCRTRRTSKTGDLKPKVRKTLSIPDMDSGGGIRAKTSNTILNRKRAMSLSKPSIRNSLAQIGNFRSLESHNRRHARKALRTISFILGAFIICWIPYHIIMMIKGFCDDLETQTSCVSVHLYNLSYWLCYMNSPINPFCYALSNASFRRTFFRILRGDFQRK
ncbi:unnamed protein product [Echinostoma caproni]|uniref:G_PROTEIN_RECEP_F1_2 domain-containing protein n=1 Tax=Echinostoma caproni TaxID=27848 RepID=A0A183A7B2_9TREM|nr:unnamed protein product [Echinostoma caproni]